MRHRRSVAVGDARPWDDQSAAPSYGAVPTILEQATESDGEMIALHRQARLALAQLQSQSGSDDRR